MILVVVVWKWDEEIPTSFGVNFASSSSQVVSEENSLVENFINYLLFNQYVHTLLEIYIPFKCKIICAISRAGVR